MAEARIPLEDLNKSHAYDDFSTLKELEVIFNDSSYDTIKSDNFLLNTSNKTKIEKMTEKIKIKMTNDNIVKLNYLMKKTYANINHENIELVLKTDLRQNTLSKDGELYLRTLDTKFKQVKFGNNTYKAINITSGKGKYLKELNTLQSEGMSVKDNYFQLLINENKTNETSFTMHDDQGNVIGNVENQNINQNIERTNTVLKALADIHDDLITSTPINAKQRSLIEEDVRPMLQLKELNNVLTEEDRQLITKYLDFIEKNGDKLAQLQNDINYFEKEIQKSEKQL